MEWNWLYSLIYGFIGGLSEFLPISSDAQQMLMLKIVGLSNPGPLLSLAIHFGALLALSFMYYSKISKLLREKKLASIPPRRRRRQPDAVSLIELRLLKIAVILPILSAVATFWLLGYLNRFWILAIVLCMNGVILLLPEYMPKSNKDARSLSPLDALLIGASGVLAIVPGISRVGMLTSCASMRGTDQQYSLTFVYLLLIPIFAVLSAVDIAVMLFGAAEPVGVSMILNAFLAFAGAFGASIAGIYLMRFLSVKIGYSAFGYYSFGLGLFTFILYLIG